MNSFIQQNSKCFKMLCAKCPPLCSGFTALGDGWSRMVYIDGLVQDCSNSRVVAMELLQSCTMPPISWLAACLVALQTVISATGTLFFSHIYFSHSLGKFYSDDLNSWQQGLEDLTHWSQGRETRLKMAISNTGTFYNWVCFYRKCDWSVQRDGVFWYTVKPLI